MDDTPPIASRAALDAALTAVARALAQTRYRNAYERTNAYQSNLERLDRVEQALRASAATMGLGDDEIASYSQQASELRQKLHSKHDPTASAAPLGLAAGVVHAALGSPITLAAMMEAADEISPDDIIDLKGLKIKKKEKKDKDKEGKEKKDKEKKDKEKTPKRSKGGTLTREEYEQAASAEAAQGSQSNDLLTENERQYQKLSESLRLLRPRSVLIEEPNLMFDAIPPCVVDAPRAIVELVPDTPHAALLFDLPLLYSGGNRSTVRPWLPDGAEPGAKKVFCRVVLYRALLNAIWHGPQSPLATQQRSKQDSRRTYQEQQKANLREEALRQAYDLGGPLDVAEEDLVGEDEVYVYGDGDEEEDPDDVLRETSEALVAEYDEAEEAAFLAESMQGLAAPSVIPHPMPFLLRATHAPWAVLMCHGGYFAGGVFVNGVAVVHKAFQRYVIRKKQGGMQSKTDKTGGCMNSAGSQIRRHNELKWKIGVRDTLVQWRSHIDSAWIILYVAPGPANRTVLTDFSELPVSAGGGTAKGTELSPVDLKDPRVRSAPLTTHRPTFSEVTRIYETVSKCLFSLIE